MKAVFDSSPIIFLTKLGIIEAALDLFDRIDIPSLVYSEIRRKPDASAEAVEVLIKGKRVSVSKAENERFVNALGRRLGKGEAEAIALSIETGADLVILDDHAARVEAMRLGLSVKGTLGVVRRLMENGAFEKDLEDLFIDLKAVGFRIRPELFWDIFSGIDQKR
jgi:predicted nucleic acid-binding protein